MADDTIRRLMACAREPRIRRDIFHLAKDPLPFRKLKYTVPGRPKCTLYEADDFIRAQLRASRWAVEDEAVQVQAFRCDASKPKAHQYSAPAPDDPWYTAYNIYGKRSGLSRPEEVILLCAHKDSQSWVDSPGAHDNATGTAGLLEIARVLAGYEPQRSIWLLFCNEEHWPWTSVAAAEGCRRRGDDLVAVLNCDGLGARTAEEIAADRKVHGMLYTVEEARWLVELLLKLNEEHGIGLSQAFRKREQPGDDDGSFVKAGYPAAVFSGGSTAGEYPDYHRESDVPEHVDLGTVRMITQLTLAAVLRLDREGAPSA